MVGKSAKRAVGRPRNVGGGAKHLGVYVAPDDYAQIVRAAGAAEAPSISSWAAGILVREAKKQLA